MGYKICAIIILLMMVASSIAYAQSQTQVTIPSSGQIMTTWDSCENFSTINGDWYYISSYENLTVNNQNMVEGSGSFYVTISDTAYSSFIYKRPNGNGGWHWDFSTAPILTFQIYPVGHIPSGGILLELTTSEDGGWNLHDYSINNLVADSWNEVTIDLRIDNTEYDMSNALTVVSQINILSINEQVAFNYYFDSFEFSVGSDLPLRAKVTPTMANAYPGELVSLKAMPSYGAGYPYVYQWSTGQTSNEITVQYGALGSYQISCQIYSVNKPGEIVTVYTTVNIVLQPQAPTRLHTSGSTILDSNNNIVYLRGVNFGGFGDTSAGGFDNASSYDGSSVFRPDVALATFNAMAKNGVNSVRIMIIMDWWKDNFKGYIDFSDSGGITNHPDASYPAYRDVVKQTVSIANQAGLYITVSVWTSDYSTYGRRLELPFPSNSFPDASSVTAFWLDMANELSDYPNTIFEFYNEPNPSDPILETTFEQYSAMVDATVLELRSHGYDVPVLVQWGYAGGFNADALGGVGEPTNSWLYRLSQTLQDHSNIIYSTHLYRYHGTFGIPPPSWTDYSTVYDYLWNDMGYNLPIEWDLPVLIGETGAIYGDVLELETFNSTLRCLNEWHMSYLAFTWKPSMWKLTDYPMSNPVLTETGIVFVNRVLEGST